LSAEPNDEQDDGVVRAWKEKLSSALNALLTALLR
jgi:hypothetical protein